MKKSISSRETATSEGVNSRVLDEEEPQQVPAETRKEEKEPPVPLNCEEKEEDKGESCTVQRNFLRGFENQQEASCKLNVSSNGVGSTCAARRSKLSFPKHVEADEEHSS